MTIEGFRCAKHDFEVNKANGPTMRPQRLAFCVFRFGGGNGGGDGGGGGVGGGRAIS